ncbi:FAD-dependent oxidoreductase [Ectopseudomonas hydrolytica]|uniref:FAD-dependent oxidoreductase n=1 Tax=Ectopseudomonas hydrolytica TaxID=2493633 RepID=UPI0010FBE646|nr:FAD-dependent oxidoreductase [Pseudomonas hydrolytica]ARS48989.1 oxidoreductase [Pseudomonas mendocina]UTH34087.1 FAD-dependent oxidoreductase [Pseudomonas hydrolytica]
MPALSATPDCCWTVSAPKGDFPTLSGHCECEVVVVGAGIAGLSAALALSEAGKSVMVLEAREVGRQVTGLSTAKITTQHALIYRELLDGCGETLARAYADANRQAMQRIAEWIERYAIDCDYQQRSAYAYAISEAQKAAVVKEAEAARSLGLEARVLHQAPLPFATSCALEFPQQAQFNPASYLVGLAQAVQARGGRVFERTRAMSFEHDERWQVGFEGGVVSADQLVLATHMPVQTPVDYISPTQPRCHVAIAFRPREGEAVDGMFIAVEEPTRSIRMGQDAEGPLLIVLGPRFNTGQDGNVAQRFDELEHWARQHLPVAEPVWRWCNEDYDTPDRMAYVGEPDPDQSPGLFVATGFSAWGITNGTAAGLGLAEQIVSGRWPWGALFDPRRSAGEDLNQSSDSHTYIDSVEDLGPGEGGVLRRGEDKLAVWRDDAGAVHALSAECTHMGCPVTWNNADRTWDCPCHGSIFEADGAVRHGPAREPLAKRRLRR